MARPSLNSTNSVSENMLKRAKTRAVILQIVMCVQCIPASNCTNSVSENILERAKTKMVIVLIVMFVQYIPADFCQFVLKPDEIVAIVNNGKSVYYISSQKLSFKRM